MPQNTMQPRDGFMSRLFSSTRLATQMVSLIAYVHIVDIVHTVHIVLVVHTARTVNTVHTVRSVHSEHTVPYQTVPSLTVGDRQ